MSPSAGATAGVRTYLDAKVAWARRTGAIEHHLVVLGERERHVAARHELPGLRVSPSNAYRIPPGLRSLQRTLIRIRPDVVLLHDPYWGGRAAQWVARELGAATISVHHSSVALRAAGLPGPEPLWRPLLRLAHRRAYRAVDAVMSVVDTTGDGRRAPTMPLRLGLDPAFHPCPRPGRGDHVLYAGRLGREKGVFELLEATALSRDPWPVHPQAYASARCVVLPGAHETFGLALLEAAACGARVVASDTCPAAGAVAPVVSRFRAGDPAGLLRAIERARLRLPDPRAAQAIGEAHQWDRAFEAELCDLERVVAA